MQYRTVDLYTERSIQDIKNLFLQKLQQNLHLHHVYAPLYVSTDNGINDNLTGTEQPVSFSTISDHYEIVHSLAKWKRMRLRELKIPLYEGIVTNMMALRPAETPSDIHSILVDQWDWEMHISKQDRTLDFLKMIVSRIYEQIKATETELAFKQCIEPVLPPAITFIHTEDLLALYPDKAPKERENLIVAKHGAVFLTGIGNQLADGAPHDGRAPDYDDWSTPTDDIHSGLNGDILLWHPVLKRSLEISSMGIRVDAAALNRQLSITQTTDRKKLAFHKALLNDQLPFSIGGGIGQSRLCMFMLRKQHIKEVQYCEH